MKKLIINGHAQHGKDYLADAVAEEFGLQKLNSSMWFAETVLMPAFPNTYSCVEHAYKDRVNHRALWYQMMLYGDWQKKFMEHSDIFCGHRNIEEHQEMQSIGCLSIWVEWVGRSKEPPSSSQWQSEELIKENHDLILEHNGFGTASMLSSIKELYNG